MKFRRLIKKLKKTVEKALVFIKHTFLSQRKRISTCSLIAKLFNLTDKRFTMKEKIYRSIRVGISQPCFLLMHVESSYPSFFVGDVGQLIMIKNMFSKVVKQDVNLLQATGIGNYSTRIRRSDLRRTFG